VACGDCQKSVVGPLVGEEPWREARLLNATGLTGPTGVVQDMAGPTGPFGAIVESGLCDCGSLGLIGTTTAFGFDQFPFPGRGQRYRDGTVRLYALTDPGLSRGVWIELDAPPVSNYPKDTAGSGRVGFPLVVLETDLQTTPTLIESGDYVFAERPLFIESNWYMRGEEWILGSREGLVSGGVRVRIGRGEDVVYDLHDLRPAAGHERSLTNTAVRAAIMPYDAVGQLLSASQQVNVGFHVSFSDDGGQFANPRYETTLPATVSASQLYGAPLGPDTSFEFRHAVNFSFDDGRILSAYPNTPPVNFEAKPIGISLEQASIKGNGRTDVFLPTGATGPHFNREGYYNGLNGDRPDLHYDTALVGGYKPSVCYSADGPHWHEDAIVRAGYSLSQNNARHKLSITFPPKPNQPERDAIGFYNFLEGVPRYQFNPNFYWFAENETIELLPSCAGKNLLPRMYASGLKEFASVTVSSLPPTAANFAGGAQSIPCDVEIQLFCHAFAFTRKIAPLGGAPGLSLAGSNPLFLPEWPAVGPLQYNSLPLPGDQGMELDFYNIFAPPTLHSPPHMLGAVIDVYFQWWFKITARRLDEVDCNRVWYRSPNLAGGLSPNSSTRVKIPLSNANCVALSDGSSLTGYGISPGLSDLDAHIAATVGVSAASINLREKEFTVQLAIV
jgi:hypothetical protein